MDANGTEQTYYYTEAYSSNAGGGYKTNVYSVAKAIYALDSTSSEMKNWLKTNVIDVVE
jgi:hypothetical protein